MCRRKVGARGGRCRYLEQTQPFLSESKAAAIVLSSSSFKRRNSSELTLRYEGFPWGYPEYYQYIPSLTTTIYINDIGFIFFWIVVCVEVEEKQDSTNPFPTRDAWPVGLSKDIATLAPPLPPPKSRYVLDSFWFSSTSSGRRSLIRLVGGFAHVCLLLISV